MANTAVATDAPAPVTGAKKATRQSGAAPGAKKTIAKFTQPTTSEMVNNAIKGMKERNGSSLRAIKKYIATHYNVDAEKLDPFIKKYLKSAVETGALIQINGEDATGSLKLESKPWSDKNLSAKAGTGKPAAGKKDSKKGAKKTISSATGARTEGSSAPKDKKTAAAKKKPTAKKAAAPTKPTADPKPKKIVKTTTTKPKASKLKKTTTTLTKISEPAAKKTPQRRSKSRSARQ